MSRDSTLENKHNGILVIAKAAAVMRALGDNPKGLSLAAIAHIVELPRSTVQRIIAALEAEYLVESLGARGGFRLGPALGQLINKTQSDIISVVRPFICELSLLVGESVTLGSLIGDKIYIVERIVSERELRIVFPIGIQPPSYATSSGKVLLAGLNSEAVIALLPESLPKLTPMTLDKTALLTQLDEIRVRSVAHDQEEYIEGICSVAVSINTYLGNYAIAVVAPASRTAARAEQFEAALVECKERIERMIGSSNLPKRESLNG
ncbi:helix-turn-helix domain-containing protein [Pseudomonas helleri]|uniref:Helix-turn-helix domain-containing protein n=1 Tax=Pseudomonas helleri TaxID=1608996 RepID=A0A7X2C231_9PSED|nr:MULTISPECIES: IclR family transcriptional regulator [Pseudomonas]MQT49399.1 helix-turn-helix domain-containing protein [Pseudomonas helleri]MQT59842.1 helix-turn-helix domain-containing protein [Pseudomonas sp. FSL R10-0399]MQT88206.1 helix-turn-helix domain-containing protein [Pseudomonas helleri]